MSEPLVSVLICTIREEPRLSLTLDCLARQTYQNFELVYVDALRDKRSESFIAELENFGDFYKVKHVKDRDWSELGKRPGISNARNSGMLYAKGDIICSTGDNTWFPPTWIERHVNLINNGYISVSPCYNITNMEYGLNNPRLEKHPEHPKKIYVDVTVEASGSFTYKYEAPVDCRMPGLTDDVFFGNDKFIQVPGGYLHGVSFALSLDRYLNVNGQDENFDKNGYGFEDCDLGVRLARMGFKLVLDPANWVVSINDKYNPTLNEMFKTSGEANSKLWEATSKGETPIWANETFNLRKVREKLEWYKQ